MSASSGLTQAGGDRTSAARRGAALVFAVLAGVAVAVALLLPDWPGRLRPDAFARVPVELPILLIALAIWPSRWLARTAGALLGIAVVIKIGDLASFQSLGRPFNPVLDIALLDAVMNLLTGALGRPAAIATAVGAAMAVAGILAIAVVATGAVRWLAARWRKSVFAAGAVLAALWAGLFAAGIETAPRLPAASWDTARLMKLHGEKAYGALDDRRAFAAESAMDPWRAAPGEQLFGAIRGQDVLLLFVESYGATVLDDPRYALAVGAVLDEGEARLAAAGITAVSARLTSPTAGGQSWLAHGTLLSGLWVDNQRRYDSLMVSDRPSLNRLFKRAGWRTVAAMPAITMAWPESAWYGYDRLMAADGLGYRGLPFNWVTMPDQYVLSALRREELDRAPRPPVMAEVALISSHAPWTPIPTLVDWSAVGDGRIFDAMATSGETPKEVWADPDKVRRQFRLSIEYALTTVVSYAETFGRENTVLVVVGDHQPAPLITGEEASRDVPIHILTTDAALADRFRSAGFSDGLRPAADGTVIRMDAARDVLIRAFSAEPGASPHVPGSAGAGPHAARGPSAPMPAPAG